MIINNSICSPIMPTIHLLLLLASSPCLVSIFINSFIFYRFGPGSRNEPDYECAVPENVGVPSSILSSSLQNSTLSPSASPPPPPPPLAQSSAGTAASFAISDLCIRRPWPSSLQPARFFCVAPGHGLQTEPQRPVRGRAQRLSGLAPG